MAFVPVTQCEQLCCMLQHHECPELPGHTDYRKFENRINPALGAYIFVGRRGALRIGAAPWSASSISSPVTKERLLREYSALHKASAPK